MTWTLSASIATYRPQAELFGGRSDGKLVVRSRKKLTRLGAYKCRRQLSGSEEGVRLDLATVRGRSVSPETRAKVANTRGVITMTRFENGALHTIRVEESCHEYERGTDASQRIVIH